MEYIIPVFDIYFIQWGKVGMYVSINPNVAKVASHVSEPSRSAILMTLLDGCVHPASELAVSAGIKPQTASFHLAKMVESKIVEVEKHGRHRYYKLANDEVAEVLESFLAISPPVKINSLRQSVDQKAICLARTCYDHLAGELGVKLTEAMVGMGVLQRSEQEFMLTNYGEKFLIQFGLDIPEIRKKRRSFSRHCLDWSERRHHLAGGLGKAMALRLLEVGWIRRVPSSRAVRVTKEGEIGFRDIFSISL
jgi:DNA-binding transcriptional ArsR family regulator